MNHIIGIIAMLSGFLSLALDNVASAYCCFGYAFILWCLVAREELKNKKENQS